MPKQLAIINNFSGGLNNLQNTRDIAENQLYNIENAMVDMQGGIGIAPRFSDYSSTIPNIPNCLVSSTIGYGLTVFETDWEKTGVISNNTYYCVKSADELNGRGSTWGNVFDSTPPSDYGWDVTSSVWTSSKWALNTNAAVKTSGSTDLLWYDTSISGSGGSNSLVSGLGYRVRYTMTDRTAGSITFKCGDGSASSAVSSNAVSYIDVVAGSGDLTKILTITPTSDFDGTLDDVSVHELPGTGSGGLFFSTVVDSAGDNVNKLTAWAWGNANDGNNNNFDLVSIYPVGSWISIKDAYVNVGTVVLSGGASGSANVGNYQVIGSSVAGSSGTSLHLHRPVTTESYVRATIDGLKNTGETLILNADAGTGNIAIYTRVNPSKTWSTLSSVSPYTNADIDLRPSASANYVINSHMKVRYYTGNEAVRCCDTVKANGNVIKWFGLINFTQFKGSGESVSRLGYEEHNNRLSPPTVGALYKDSNLLDATINTALSAYTGNGFGVFVKSSSDTGTYSLASGQDYEFAQTFVYDGNQESLISIYSDVFPEADFTDDKALDIRIACKGKDFNGRVTGGRIYIRIKDSDESWSLLVDLDLEKGGRTSLNADWISWSVLDGSNSTGASPIYYVGTSAGTLKSKDLSIVTYEVINGYPADTKSNSFGYPLESWSDAVVANNRAFVCNVQYSESINDDFTPKKYPDRIMYSMPGRYDTFPEHNTIDAIRGDSDSYVAITEFADRLLAFKERSMSLINIASPSDNNWFVEESYKWMGVVHPEAVRRTPYGVVWMNPYGLYIYNGSQITNLIENIIDPEYWKPKVTTTSILGYDPVKAHIIIHHNAHATDTTGAIFDLKKKTYIKTAGLITGTKYTNIVNHPVDSYMFYGVDDPSSAGQTIFKNLDTTDRSLSSGITTVSFATKDFDFGDPATIKKVYKVMITYKSDATIASSLKYYTNGTIPAFGSASAFNTITADVATNWSVGTFAITNGVVCQSFGLMFDNASNALKSLEINDISIEYRVIKGRRVIAT